MKRHVIKIWPDYFCAVSLGRKTFEIRKNDRDYLPGDYVVMREWDPMTRKYTGWQITATIGWMTTVNADANQVAFSLVHVDSAVFRGRAKKKGGNRG